MLFDISPRLSPRLGVWPGDTPLAREVLLDLARGDAVTLSTLRATVHLGAHADAPSHYAPGGSSIEAVGLDPYLGRCQVLRLASTAGRPLRAVDLRGPVRAERVLIATGSHPDPQRFETGFTALSADLVQALAREGVRLIGVDTPSVDAFDSKDLPSHRACLKAGIAILEGLLLQDVPEGVYELIALPLALEGFDASPVRAVLRTLTG